MIFKLFSNFYGLKITSYGKQLAQEEHAAMGFSRS
jgi:hypothetical protein